MRKAFAPELDAFDEFTRRPFVVVDVETTKPPEGHGKQRLVSYAYTVLDSTTGFKSERHHALVNPGMPIHPDSTRIHGITTDQVEGKKDFKFHHAKLKAVLERPDVIFVAHNANFDAGVLRNEFDLIGVPFPDVAVLDTMYLPATVGFSVSGAKGKPSLPLLCDLLGVTLKNHHAANEDADATGKVLLGLLRHAASNITDTPTSKGTGIATLDDLLFVHGRGTTLSLKPSVYISSTDRASAYQLDPAHLERHSTVLDSAPDSVTIDEWVDRALECARLRCPHLISECEAAQQHGSVLLKKLWGAQPDLTEPGQYATLVGGMMRMLTSTCKPRQEARWWGYVRSYVTEAPRCTSSSACPDCRVGEPCPLDVAHEYVAASLMCSDDGLVTKERIDNYLFKERSGYIGRWADSIPEVAAHVTHLAVLFETSQGNQPRADSLVAAGTRYGFEKVEPMLALQVAFTSLGQGRDSDAEELLASLLKPGNTNPNQVALSQALARVQARRVKLEKDAEEAAKRDPGRERAYRPTDRVRLGRFTVERGRK